MSVVSFSRVERIPNPFPSQFPPSLHFFHARSSSCFIARLRVPIRSAFSAFLLFYFVSLSSAAGNLLTSACPRNKDAQATVKAHIKLLHDYNEIRDIGQGLMGIIADNKGVRVRDVYRDFDVGEGD